MNKQATATKDTPAAQASGQTKDKFELSKAQEAQVKKLPTVSARIRYLKAEGLSRADTSWSIPNASGGKLRYQHVNNVWNQKVGTKK